MMIWCTRNVLSVPQLFQDFVSQRRERRKLTMTRPVRISDSRLLPERPEFRRVRGKLVVLMIPIYKSFRVALNSTDDYIVLFPAELLLFVKNELRSSMEGQPQAGSLPGILH
jgi:hypothetical protein